MRKIRSGLGNHLTVYEMCDEDGGQSMLEEMLDNPEADRATSVEAIERAIQRGMTEELAITMYGYTEPASGK